MQENPLLTGDEAEEPMHVTQVVGPFIQRVWKRIQDFGLGQSAMALGSVILTTGFILVIALVMNRFYVSVAGRSAGNLSPSFSFSAQAAPQPVAPPFLQGIEVVDKQGIQRDASLHTILPSRARTELITYTIQSGDTLFSIAEHFGLKPESVLWGNRYTIGDDPHTIYPGQILNILPVDGVLHRWTAGEGLNGVSEFYHVTPQDIINYPANHLNAATIGDFSNPNIPEGTLLIIPGGKGEFPDWRTPRITRQNPAIASYVGPGACTGSYDGVLGTQNFSWPTSKHSLSGYDFDPSANHYAIDIGGDQGDPILAADNGVVVYAGWNDLGYGEMVVIDHGAGWQSLYAHLATVSVKCGQEVYRGDQLGTMGSTGQSTGPHLHFEMRSDRFGRVNPLDFLN